MPVLQHLPSAGVCASMQSGQGAQQSKSWLIGARTDAPFVSLLIYYNKSSH